MFYRGGIRFIVGKEIVISTCEKTCSTLTNTPVSINDEKKPNSTENFTMCMIYCRVYSLRNFELFLVVNLIIWSTIMTYFVLFFSKIITNPTLLCGFSNNFINFHLVLFLFSLSLHIYCNSNTSFT